MFSAFVSPLLGTHLYQMASTEYLGCKFQLKI
jgi:hypothetical protein